MKKIVLTFLLIAAAGQAQVTFRPGIRAGVNFAHLSTNGDFNDNYYYADDVLLQQSAEYNNKTDFYVGLYGALRLTKYYTLQPEVNYSRQGANVEYIYGGTRQENTLDLSYLSVGIVNKFTFNRVMIELGPTIDVIVNKSRNRTTAPYYLNEYYYEGDQSFTDTDSDIDLAFLAGIGVSITKNIGIEARIKKGIIPVVDLSDANHDNVVYSIGAFYTFDLK